MGPSCSGPETGVLSRKNRAAIGLMTCRVAMLLLVNMRQVWAAIIITPSSPSAGQGFTIEWFNEPVSISTVKVVSGTCGSGTVVLSLSAGGTTSGSVSATGIPAGSYGVCLYDVSSNLEDSSPLTVLAASITTSMTSVVPEYPLGLLLLVVLTLVGYGIIRRRIRT